ncbi:ras and Rab interactor 1 isoform X1 [Perognathus longimembris pacificus]|uniref:ras and Rab interactor 1 isoform X1 n=1 Tax=Perognathus longimembris pacificus TaxID=214514 RepID=UPI0020185E34|nr:ras and Rab interactor 1 isoform X1 [Perognathus longimembris pacificus]
MGEPGEPAAHPLEGPSPNFALEHLQEEKPAPDPLYATPHACGGPPGGPPQPGRTVGLRERLLLTRPVWLQLRANAAAALHVLRTEPPGTFLVRKSNTHQCQALCVRLPEASGPSFVSSYYIQERPEGEGSRPGREGAPSGRGWGGVGTSPGNSLAAPSQVSPWKARSWCSQTSSSSSVPTATPGESPAAAPRTARPPRPRPPSLPLAPFSGLRDVLLLPLRLPSAIHQASTHKALEAISHLGIEFWNSSLNTKTQPGSSAAPMLPRLKARSPQELDQGTGAALCFFNPLFPGDLGPTKREQFKKSLKVRVSTETSSPLSPPAVPPPPVPVPPGPVPSHPEWLPPRQLLRRESSVGYRVPVGASPRLPPLPSLQEVDCGSPSGSEEEGPADPQRSPATSPHLGRRRRRRPLLRSMSSAFCSLLAPERQVGRAAATLTQDRHTAVGQLVQDLLTQVRAGPEPQELRNIRQALSRARAMLSAELGPEKLLPPERLELVLEKSLHRSVLKPLRPLLAARLRRRLDTDGSFGRLAEGLRLARAQGPGALGTQLSLPSSLDTEQVRQKLLQLLRAYSPSAQVKRLLQACKLLYTALKTHAGEDAGADEFLPLLSLVLVQCDLPDLLLEAEYMSELLEPALLTGEGGYYLTSLSASLALLSSLAQAPGLPPSPAQELQRSLSLWEQRRLPATHSLQHLLRIAYQDPSSGCTSKTMAVPPGASVATLNQLCATKFRVAQPDAFSLFLYKEQGYHRLSPGDAAHGLPSTGYLVYRRAERPDARRAAPGEAVDAGRVEERKEGQGEEGVGIKATPGDGDAVSQTPPEGDGDQSRESHVQPEEPEAEGGQAAGE